MRRVQGLDIKIDSEALKGKLTLWEHIFDLFEFGTQLSKMRTTKALCLYRGKIRSMYGRTKAESGGVRITNLRSDYMMCSEKVTRWFKPDLSSPEAKFLAKMHSYVTVFETRVHDLAHDPKNKVNDSKNKAENSENKVTDEKLTKYYKWGQILTHRFEKQYPEIFTHCLNEIWEECMDTPLSNRLWAGLEEHLIIQQMQLRLECARLYLEQYMFIRHWTSKKEDQYAEEIARDSQSEQKLEQKEHSTAKRELKGQEQKQQVNRAGQHQKTNVQHSQQSQRNVQHSQVGEEEIEEAQLTEEEVDPFEDPQLIYIHSRSPELLLNARVIEICRKLCHLPTEIEYGDQPLPLTTRYGQVHANWEAVTHEEREAVVSCLISIYAKNVLWHAYALEHIYHSLLGGKGASEDPEARLSCTKVVFIHLLRLYQIIVERSRDHQHLPEYDRALLGALQSPSEHLLMETPRSLSFIAVINGQSRIYFLKNDLHLLNRPIFYEILGDSWIHLFGKQEEMRRCKRG